MCGIVGAISSKNIVPFLLDGLKKLEYRGYDSAGIGVITPASKIKRVRRKGKVSVLEEALKTIVLEGSLGIAHTRWATHGVVCERNAHPHMADDRILLVHNGIVENYQHLKNTLLQKGYQFFSDTDSEVIASGIADQIRSGKDLFTAVQSLVSVLEGAYTIAVVDLKNPEYLVVVCFGPPLVIGLGEQENFVASDVLALQGVAHRFIYLEEGDIAKVGRHAVQITDKAGQTVQRSVLEQEFEKQAIDKGTYPHFMLKEIFQQPEAIRSTLLATGQSDRVAEQLFGQDADKIFDQVQHVQIIACGTSFHASSVARLWFEELAGISCQVEVASEFHYRKKVVLPNTLLVLVSQSGETADVIGALKSVKHESYLSNLAICNVLGSTLCRSAELVFLTKAGPEIGVCSTKAFTTQLVALFLLVLSLGRRRGLSEHLERHLFQALNKLPEIIESWLREESLQSIAKLFENTASTLFLGRGLQYPIALEGALKLKEISYIHAEAYPAGELKHGPLALVDEGMLVVILMPNNALLEKVKSNLQEIRSRGGKVILLTPSSTGFIEEPGVWVLSMPEMPDMLTPIFYSIPLQLLAYYVAVLRGTDVDQPRNLAKSVTVE